MFEMQAIIPENWDLFDKPINEVKEENQIKVKLNDGDILIIRNHRVLHGRSRFEGHRRMARIWYKGSCK